MNYSKNLILEQKSYQYSYFFVFIFLGFPFKYSEEVQDNIVYKNSLLISCELNNKLIKSALNISIEDTCKNNIPTDKICTPEEC